MSEPHLTSPNQLMDAAKKYMLGGREPQSKLDWVMIVNFWASNILPEVNASICLILKLMYNCPLEDEMIEKICQFQNREKDNVINN
jgi:hypothetical protein